MSTAATPLHVLMAIYRMVVALCNACIVFLQVMRSAMQEAKQEAAEVMALLDDDMMVSPLSTVFLASRVHPLLIVPSCLTGRDHVLVVVTRHLWTHERVANVGHREGVVVRAPPPAI